jgi:hypothetical protein
MTTLTDWIRKSWWGLLLLAAVAVSGCNALSIQSIPTPYPTEYLPTLIALTVQARQGQTQTAAVIFEQTAPQTPAVPASQSTANLPGQNPVPESTPSPDAGLPESTPTGTSPVLPTSAGASPTPTVRPPTSTRTPTRTPDLPIAHIQIFKPGPASRVVSPIKVTAYLIPGARGNVRMELLGEDGRMLVRKIVPFGDNITGRVYANAELTFEIEAVAEAGRLIISTEDAKGRTISLASVDLLLLNFGYEDITPAGEQKERIVLREPTKNLLIQGGTIIVSGLVLPLNDNPLMVEVVSEDGRYLAPVKQVAAPRSTDGSYMPFSAEVPYTVTRPTWVRVSISQRDFNIPSLLHLVSVEVLISP